MVLTDLYFFIFLYIILIFLIYSFLKKSNIQRNQVVKYLIVTFLISVFLILSFAYLSEIATVCGPGEDCKQDLLGRILRDFDELVEVTLSLFLILMLIISLVKYFRRRTI